MSPCPAAARLMSGSAAARRRLPARRSESSAGPRPMSGPPPPDHPGRLGPGPPRAGCRRGRGHTGRVARPRTALHGGPPHGPPQPAPARHARSSAHRPAPVPDAAARRRRCVGCRRAGVKGRSVCRVSARQYCLGARAGPAASQPRRVGSIHRLVVALEPSQLALNLQRCSSGGDRSMSLHSAEVEPGILRPRPPQCSCTCSRLRRAGVSLRRARPSILCALI